MALLAHITPLEAPIVWFAFAAGLLLGIVGTVAVLRRQSQKTQS